VRDVFMVCIAALFRVVNPSTEFDPGVIEQLIENLRNAPLGLDSASPFYSMGG
jgi:hypothetical protein